MLGMKQMSECKWDYKLFSKNNKWRWAIRSFQNPGFDNIIISKYGYNSKYMAAKVLKKFFKLNNIINYENINKKIKRIPLFNSNKYALVDRDDYVRVMQHSTWSNHKGNYIFSNYNSRYRLPLHRFILCLSPGDGNITDHKNRNPLDNRRCNLRLASHSENAVNCTAHKSNKYGIKGVYKKKLKNGWIWYSKIKYKGRSYYLGYTKDLILAAERYNIKMKEIYGEFAYLNDIERIKKNLNKINEQAEADEKRLANKRTRQV